MTYEEALEILALAPVDLEKKVDTLDTNTKREIADTLSRLAEVAASKAAYFEERYGYGCGDQGHKKAVKEFNRVRKAVRKALGFNITHPITF